MQPFGFHPTVAAWFEQQFGSPTLPQEQGWPAIQSGRHTLIAAPTGSGKTLAAFFASLDQLFRQGLAGTLQDETSVVYISPLKALSNDIHKNLDQPLAGLRAALLASEGRDIVVRADVRNGDTSAAKRQAIIRRPPHILVTTPESFYLLLTSASGRKLLANVRTLIVDEIHAVVGNRRGSHLAVSMERLTHLVGQRVQRIGLSATQKPIGEVARFLVGTQELEADGNPRCTIVDSGFTRRMDLALEVPGTPLEAVMSGEVWTEVYDRLAELIKAHRTTLVFVNTRRMAERVTHHLATRLGKERVAAHHGSLSAPLRLEAEHRLKRGELQTLVATASLELGIDIGSVDLVCQLGATHSIANFLQRVGRAEHQRGGLPKGRLFPLSRDELVECLALLRSVRQGELDSLEIPAQPLDLLAQQIVACVACEDWDEQNLFDLVRSAYPYRHLAREDFEAVLRMLAEGFSTRRGRRGALVHHDAINHRVRARRGGRLLAITSGGAIADNADYRVILEPAETFIGTVNEDFAVESLSGDIFQLGSASWKILSVRSGVVRVEDAHGQPPNIPFWLGEAPGRTAELSRSVSNLHALIEERIEEAARSDEPHTAEQIVAAALATEPGLGESAARQLAVYFLAIHKSLGVIPSQEKLVLERFFDESGGMQLVIHSPFGIRVNRAWGLALRKRFCRSFNFELQAAATDDAIVLSLGTQHSFPLEDVWRYLNSKSVRDLLIQALLDAPMFGIRWRWNASRALALPRQRGGRKVPPPLLRMEAENLLAAVFPDQLACLENIPGDREVPNHPLVAQTITDCLTEVMDIDGLIQVLTQIESGQIQCFARDLPEPSPLAHEILNAHPYAFLDDAPLEERRTQAVYTRRSGSSSPDAGLGILDAAAIDAVEAEAWPQAANVDELHEALLLAGLLTAEEVRRVTVHSSTWLEELSDQKRAGRLRHPAGSWVAAERWPMIQAIYPDCVVEPRLTAPAFEAGRAWEKPEAVRELVRGRMEITGPTTAETLAKILELPLPEIEAALLALEAEGFVLRGRFHPQAVDLEWCNRRLLARIHRRTINRLRAEIQPVSAAEFQRFLFVWQRVEKEHRVEGPEGVAKVLELLDGYEVSAGGWEPEVLALRVQSYTPSWLDQLCFTGRIGWGRLTVPSHQGGRPTAPIRSSPIALFARENLPHWLALASLPGPVIYSPDTQMVLAMLNGSGALFFDELVQRTALLPSRVEEALGTLAAHGMVTADSFEGLRALLLPADKRGHPSDTAAGRRHHRPVTTVARAGRWSLLRSPDFSTAVANPDAGARHAAAVEAYGRVLLKRYGVVFRRLLERESLRVSWAELSRVYRQLEARGEIRGGHFVSGISGEQFALADAIGLLRSVRRTDGTDEMFVISGADPLNLAGILSPGPRVPAITSNRIVIRDGVPAAALEAGQIIPLAPFSESPDPVLERSLRVGTMPVSLRAYYG